MIPRLVSRLARFLRHTRGAVSVEFALLVPVMLTNLFGMIEVVELFDANARARKSAAAAADVISRFPEDISGTEICDVFEGVKAVAEPKSDSDLSVRITFITVNSVGQASVAWSDAKGVFPEIPQHTNLTAEIPPNLIVANTADALVRAEIELIYHPPIIWTLTGPVTLRSTQFRRPRISIESNRTSNCIA